MACSYNGGRTAEAFLAYLQEKVAADKGFARIGSLDTLARDFLAAADKTGAAAAFKAAAKKLDEAQRAAGLLYGKFAEKAVAKVCRCRQAQALACASACPNHCACAASLLRRGASFVVRQMWDVGTLSNLTTAGQCQMHFHSALDSEGGRGKW